MLKKDMCLYYKGKDKPCQNKKCGQINEKNGTCLVDGEIKKIKRVQK